jgi:hypothetical protein
LVENGHLRFEVAQNNTLMLLKGEDFQIFKQFEIPISERSIAGYVALTGKILNIPDVYELSADFPFQFNPDLICAIIITPNQFWLSPSKIIPAK